MKFELNGEFIRLGDMLKAAGLTGTGGEAKQAVQDLSLIHISEPTRH